MSWEAVAYTKDSFQEGREGFEETSMTKSKAFFNRLLDVVPITETRCGRCALLMKNRFQEGYCCPQNGLLVREVRDFAAKCTLFRSKTVFDVMEGDFMDVPRKKGDETMKKKHVIKKKETFHYFQSPCDVIPQGDKEQ
jgi:hypothetical protein